MRARRRRRYHSRRKLVTQQEVEENRRRLQGFGQKAKSYDHAVARYSTLPDTYVPLLPKNKAALVLVVMLFFMAAILAIMPMVSEPNYEYGSYYTSFYTGLDGGEHIVHTFICDQDGSISGYLDMATVDGDLIVDEIVDVYKCGTVDADKVGDAIDDFASSMTMLYTAALKTALWIKQQQSLFGLSE